MNPQTKRKITLHQRGYFSEPSMAWRLPVNMNIEEGESKKQLYRSENYLSSSLKYLQFLDRKFQSGKRFIV
jgi:hypothetical protein